MNNVLLYSKARAPYVWQVFDVNAQIRRAVEAIIGGESNTFLLTYLLTYLLAYLLAYLLTHLLT